MLTFIRRHWLACTLLAVGLAAAAGYAVAQQSGAYPIASPTGAERIEVDSGTSPVFNTVSLGQIRDSSGFIQQTPLTGFSITVPAGPTAVSVVELTPAGTLATGTIVFPNTPVNGQRLQVFSTQTITALTLTPGSGQSINAAVTTLAANANVEYIYQSSNTTWYRVQ